MHVNILEDTVLNMKLKYKYLYLNQFKAGNLFRTTEETIALKGYRSL